MQMKACRYVHQVIEAESSAQVLKGPAKIFLRGEDNHCG